MQINTNIAAMTGLNQLRLNERTFERVTSNIATGLRLRRGADDPSGLAISQNMRAQLSGTSVAIQNVEDTINLIRVADNVLESITNIVIEMRNLCVRLANQATLSNNPAGNALQPPNPSDSRIIKDELVALRLEIERIASSASFGEKTGIVFGEYASGLQYAQVGPDNTDAQHLNIVLPDLNGLLTALPVPSNPFEPASDADASEWLSFAMGILDDIDEKNTLIPVADRFGLPKLLQSRAELGVAELRLQAILNDLNSQYINVSAAKSRITDADIAEEVTTMTRTQILNNMTMGVLAQANTSFEQVLSLLDRLPSYKMNA